jgi:NAD(P) transhydrogenase subunit alpha
LSRQYGRYETVDRPELRGGRRVFRSQASFEKEEDKGMARRMLIPLGIAVALMVVLGVWWARDSHSGPAGDVAATQVASHTAAGSDEGSMQTDPDESAVAGAPAEKHAQPSTDQWPMLFVFVLATFIGIGVVARVSRLLHTPLMSITNAISAIAVVGSIIVTGSDYPRNIQIMGAIALFASMTNIVSGFLITDRMLKMFKSPREEVKK